MKLSTRVAWNAVTTLLAEGLVVMLQFWLVRFLIDRLGDEYGLTTLVATFIVYLMMVDMGLRRALTRQLAASIAQNKPEQANQFFNTALFSLLALSSVLVVVCLVGAPWIIRLARVGPRDFEMAVSLVRWYVSPMIVLSLISPLFKSVLIALNRFDLVNFIRLAEVATRFTVIVAALTLTPAGLYGWALGMGSGLAVEFVLSALAGWRLVPYLRLRPGHYHLPSLGQLGTLGMSSVVYETGQSLAITTHPLIISRYVGVAANVAYDPARQVVLAIDVLVGAITRQVLPMATHYHSTGDSETLRELLIRGTRFTLVLGGPCCVLLALYAEPLLRSWQTAAFAPHLPAAVAALTLWCAINLVKYVSGTQYMVLFGMRHVWFVSLLELAQAVLALVGSIALTAWLAGWMGEVALIGVLIPTLVCSLVARVINTVQVARAVNVPLSRYVAEGYWGPLRALAAIWGVGSAVIWLIPPTNVVWFLISGGLSGLAAVPLCWWLALDVRDRQLFERIWKRRRGGSQQQPAPQTAAVPDAVDA